MFVGNIPASILWKVKCWIKPGLVFGFPSNMKQFLMEVPLQKSGRFGSFNLDAKSDLILLPLLMLMDISNIKQLFAFMPGYEYKWTDFGIYFHNILESKNFKVIMRLSPIGSITCSIKGPFVRASAAQGEDIYLSQTFYSAANLYPRFNFFYAYIWQSTLSLLNST